MTIFLDTGVIVALDNQRDPMHKAAIEKMAQVRSGAYGNWAYTSDYIFDESLTLSFARTGNMEISKELAKKLLAAKSLTILHVTEDVFRESTNFYIAQYGNLSFTDCISVQLMKENGIEYIATFDAGFKKIPRIKVVP